MRFWLVVLLLACVTGCTSAPRYQVVGFTAAWCGVCQQDKPQLAQIKVPVQMIDVDQYPALARAYGAPPVPLYILFEDGREILRTHDLGEVQRRIK